jgi:hypothetical protein
VRSRRRSKPVELFLDLFVYAPIGFVVEAPRVVPELIESGRRQLSAARGLGRLAVHVGYQRLSGRSSDEREPVPSSPTERRAPITVSAVDVTNEADLPIPGYDQLAASHVVARLAGLDADGLRAVEDYERAHRKRRTILAKVAQLRRT